MSVAATRRLHLRLEAPESTGDFVASKIIAKEDGTYQVSPSVRR